jgi:hypothetical protein
VSFVQGRYIYLAADCLRTNRRSVNGDLRIPESNDLQPTDNGILNFADPWGRDRRRVITFDQGNNTAFGQNLTSTGDDSRSPWGYTRGGS